MENDEKVKKSVFNNPILNTKVKSANVKIKEMIFGYFLGPFGALLSSGIFASFLNYYWTDVLFRGADEGISTFLMLLPLLSTVLVVVGNLVMGQLLERTKTMQGKARPWILLSAFALAAACVLMFVMPFGNDIARMVWIAISYNLYYSIAYPIYNTANSTMIPLSTRNGKQRGLLASVTNVAGLGVMGAGSMVFPILISMFLNPTETNAAGEVTYLITSGDSMTRWLIVMIAVAVFGLMSCLLQYFFTRERVTEETKGLDTKKEKIPVKQQLKAVTSNKMWWVIIIFYLLFQFSGAIKNLSMVYFCKWVVDNSFWGVDGGFGMTQTLLAVLGAVPMAIAVVFVWPLSNKFGKKNVTVAGMIIGAAGGLIAGLGGSNIVPVAIGIAMKCLGSAPACYMILAMIADSLDHIEAKNGFRCDGLTMSIYSSIMVAATGIGTALLNGLMGAGGYNADLTAQPDGALTAISVSYIWIETIAYAACAILLLLFTVEKNLPGDQQTILQRQKAAVLAEGKEWIEPAERLRIEQEEFDRIAEEARIAESKAYCGKKGVSFEERETAYQAKKSEKEAAAKAKADAKAAKKKKGG